MQPAQPDSPNTYANLKKLGLNKTAVTCYENLFHEGGATATQLAERLHIARTSLYRTLHALEAAGFVSASKASEGPTYFHAVKLNIALLRLAEYQRRAVRDILEEQWQVLEQRNPPRAMLLPSE